MKQYIKIILLLLLPFLTNSQVNPLYIQPQPYQLDSLMSIYKNTNNDTTRMEMCRDLGYYYHERNKDSALYFHQQQLLLAKQLKQRLWEADAYDLIGWLVKFKADFVQSLQTLLQGLKLAEDPSSERDSRNVFKLSTDGNPKTARLTILAAIHLELGELYGYTGNIEKRRFHYSESERIAQGTNDKILLSYVNFCRGHLYSSLKQPDSALAVYKKALDYTLQSGFERYKGHILRMTGRAYLIKQDKISSKRYTIDAIEACEREHDYNELAGCYTDLAKLFRSDNELDSSIFYAKKALDLLQSVGSIGTLSSTYTFLSSVYKLKNQSDSAFRYLELAVSEKSDLKESEKMKQFQQTSFDEEIRLRQLEEEKKALKNKFRNYAMLAALGMFLIIALFLYRNNRQKQKAKIKIEKAYDELKSTQAQLIQQEKMASLGELTAGIAHEIQNPLNFVNNFSDVSNELIEEMKSELTTGNTHSDSYRKANEIADDIKQNLEKINHHGKRADAIVKGMLQHSRSSSGKKEPTDINALADEYLRLAYHGMRAKDKSFDVITKTDFDDSIGKINVVPQDIGRVILNLINNAFYAVSEKQKQNLNRYEPTVTVSTKKEKDKVEIKVKDNGNGIPQKILDKIFQPFFTTKPTGQGTGLGLSLSYDIIKAHGGEIKVETKEDEGSTFIILLPSKVDT